MNCGHTQGSFGDPYTPYLAFNGHGAGHYDALHHKPKVTLPSSCRCGVNTKDKTDKHFCVNADKDAKYKSRCPCLKQNTPCTEKCSCFQCGNPFGNRPSLSTSRRKRIAHLYQGSLPCSKKFAMESRRHRLVYLTSCPPVVRRQENPNAKLYVQISSSGCI